MDDQDLQLLRDTAREWATAHAPLDADHHAARDRYEALRRGMAGLGWPGVAIAAEHDGAGMGLAACAVLLEEMGRRLAPSALLSTSLIAAQALAASELADEDAALRRIAGGDLVVGLSLAAGPGDTLAIARSGDGWTVSGTRRFVLDAPGAGLLLVADAAGLFALPAEACEVTAADTIDGRRFGHVMAAGVAAVPIADADETARLLDLARLGLASEMIGACAQALDITVDYLKTREQFGRRIGSFQALAHRAAQMLVELELARSAVAAAWAAVGAPRAVFAELATVARHMAGQALHRTSSEMVQMHGGIGMTAEHVAGRFLKWARVSEALFGNAGRLAERYADLKGF